MPPKSHEQQTPMAAKEFRQRVVATMHNFCNFPEAMICPSNTAVHYTITMKGVANPYQRADDPTTPAPVLSCEVPPVVATFTSRSPLKEEENLKRREVSVELAQEWGFVVAATAEGREPSNMIKIQLIAMEHPGAQPNTSSSSSSEGREIGRLSLGVDIREVLRRKIVTLVVGLPVGQVGVSFSVAPGDTQGFRDRLSAFMRRYNPERLSLIDTVLRESTELDAFTKVFRKYNVVDYDARVRSFCALYEPRMVEQLKPILEDYAGKEEELMRNLVLDNGPEPRDIDPRKRLAAFVGRYQLDDVNVEQTLKEQRTNLDVLFRGLVEKHGPEPDPRRYAFPDVTYVPPVPSRQTQRRDESKTAPPSQQQVKKEEQEREEVVEVRKGAPEAGPSPVTGSIVVGKGEKQEPAPAKTSRLVEAQILPPASSSATTTNSATAVPLSTKASVVSSLAAQQHAQHQLQHQLLQHQQHASGSTAVAVSQGAAELWSAFCADLRQCAISVAEVFYLDERSFARLVGELGYAAPAQQQLTAEWERRLAAALHVSYLNQSDAEYDTLRQEVAAMSGMHGLALQVLGVVALRHSEHEAAFAGRLACAKVKTVERLLYAAPHNDAMRIARCGFSTNAARDGEGGGEAATSLACMEMKRKPLKHIAEPSSVTLLVCDVIVGKSVVSVMAAPRVTSALMGEYDSCTTFVNTDDQGVLPFVPQQVLPRYIVHCSVDPSVVPCPVHHSKAVEYYVPEAHAFACSQCVIMGPHQGKHVVSLQDAAASAHAEFAELDKTLRRFEDDVAAKQSDVAARREALQHSDARQAAERAIDALREETERRIAQILRDVEERESHAAAELQQLQTLCNGVKEDIGSVRSHMQGASSTSSSPSSVSAASVVQSLIKLKDARGVEKLQRRMDELYGRPAATTTTSLSLATEAPASASASSSVTRARQSIPRYDSKASIYEKFMTLKGSGTPGAKNGAVPPLAPTPGSARQQQHSAISLPPASETSSLQQQQAAAAAVGGVAEREQKQIREQMSRGWGAFRAGDKAAAEGIWREIYEKHPNSAAGARSRAYVYEAVEKDYGNAALWYERALRVDPADCMTLFNYGVLLESVVGKRKEALQLFECAANLGDLTAAKRVQLLRRQLQQ